jgi:hypothetical protein
MASVDTLDGPTVGRDHSPFLAVSRALEPIGGGLIDALLIVAGLRLGRRGSDDAQAAPLDGPEPR